MDNDEAGRTRLREQLGEHTKLRVKEGVESSSAVAATTLRDRAAPVTRLRSPAVTPSATTRGAAADLEQGSLIRDRYRLEELIGQGGMGQVWRAKDLLLEQTRDPRPYVALKLLNPDFELHPDAFVALQREAGKAQQLAHPNIATVFSFDRDERSGRAFLTMELLEGRSLEAEMEERRGRGLGRATASPIIRGIAEGLAYAHRKGIVHSDLKPANIFLSGDGVPKILDFGIARVVPDSSEAAVRDAFDAGSLGGYTESYATAEMISGQAPAAADDLYSLAVIACELLDGVHPFGGKSALAAREAQARAPALRGLRRGERRAILTSLSFDRQRRPRDAAEFLRLYTGAVALRNALVAGLAILAASSGYLWYSAYREAGPAIPFDQLPVATQQRITADLTEAAKAWQFYANQRIGDALPEALGYYAEAYQLQKGNRQATAGLRRVADETLRMVGKLAPGDLQHAAEDLAQKSEYLKAYGPVRRALQRPSP